MEYPEDCYRSQASSKLFIHFDELWSLLKTSSNRDQKNIKTIFNTPGPKGLVSYCHHLASVAVVRRKLFQKSSPLKLLDQLKPNLVWIITRVFNFKIVSGATVHQPTWALLLKIEYNGKIADFWVITRKPLIISEIWHGIKMISTARSTYPAIMK